MIEVEVAIFKLSITADDREVFQIKFEELIIKEELVEDEDEDKPHEEDATTCYICLKKFKTKKIRNSHLKRRKLGHTLTCCQCKERFIGEFEYVLHLYAHIGKYKCTSCDYESKSRADIASHLKNHPIMNVTDYHIKTHTEERPYKCVECGKGFTFKNYLSKHQKIHSGERPHKCDVCNKDFTNKRYLNSHKVTHTGERPYKCFECGKDFLAKKDLKRHHRIHTGEQPYKCVECNINFTHSSTLKNHQRMHTGEKLYKCVECNKEFTHKSTLTYHQSTHTGERPYTCFQCDKSFMTKKDVKRHLQIHSRKSS